MERVIMELLQPQELCGQGPAILISPAQAMKHVWEDGPISWYFWQSC